MGRQTPYFQWKGLFQRFYLTGTFLEGSDGKVFGKYTCQEIPTRRGNHFLLLVSCHLCLFVTAIRCIINSRLVDIHERCLLSQYSMLSYSYGMQLCSLPCPQLHWNVWIFDSPMLLLHLMTLNGCLNDCLFIYFWMTVVPILIASSLSQRPHKQTNSTELRGRQMHW